MPPEHPVNRLPAASRRAAILEAAGLAFLRQGFHGTKTRDLAQSCGVSEPVLYQHFSGKQALFLAVLEHLLTDACVTMESVLETEQRNRCRDDLAAIFLMVDAATDVPGTIELLTHFRSRLNATVGEEGIEALKDAIGELVLQRLRPD